MLQMRNFSDWWGSVTDYLSNRYDSEIFALYQKLKKSILIDASHHHIQTPLHPSPCQSFKRVSYQ